MAVLRVLDRGPGLPAGTEERLFERFVRGPGAAGPGAGLGLALVREAALAHGGTARASNREGGGAAFEVRVPLAEEAT
jgi:signal transduction histidine kinase